jgi:hypothetical protein
MMSLPLSRRLLRVSIGPWTFHMVSKRILWMIICLSLLMLTTCLAKKLPHLRRRVKMSHIVKRYIIRTLYKTWTPLNSKYVFWEWVRFMYFHILLVLTIFVNCMNYFLVGNLYMKLYFISMLSNHQMDRNNTFLTNVIKRKLEF